jgi:hypothetical protein
MLGRPLSWWHPDLLLGKLHQVLQSKLVLDVLGLDVINIVLEDEIRLLRWTAWVFSEDVLGHAVTEKCRGDHGAFSWNAVAEKNRWWVSRA